jgi:enolase
LGSAPAIPAPLAAFAGNRAEWGLNLTISHMPKIIDVRAREILDSRGNPTVAVKVWVEGGAMGEASVPSGASTGAHEALELRDGDPKRYGGMGVLQAVENVNGHIRKLVKGMDAADQRGIDEAMIKLDGTPNKAKLGANAILGVSLATARAAAAFAEVPLYRWLRTAFGLVRTDWPMPLATMNILNGGRHADFAIDFQECMIVPKHRLMRERVRIGAEVFHALGKILRKKGHVTAVGDEGGYAPRLGSNEEAFKLIAAAVKAAGYALGRDVALAMDVAASEFYDAERAVYELKVEGRSLDAAGMTELYMKWLRKYPIVSIEDGLDEDDWEHWADHTAALKRHCALVGDDLFVTNVERLAMGIERKVANAILIKVNQIGSLSETMDTIALAQKRRYKTSISHRSGETADTFIADLAVAVGSEFIKTGSLSRSERLAKYNRLMEIEAELEAAGQLGKKAAAKRE